MNFLKFMSGGGKRILKKPFILAAGIFLWLVFLGFSEFGGVVAHNFQTTWANVAWTAAGVVFSLVAGSYFLSGMIGIVKTKSKSKTLRDFFYSSNRFWRRNFFALFLILLISFFIGRAAHYGAFYLGKALGLAISGATIVFVLIYFVGLVSILVFFTFASVFLVVKDLSVKESLKKSFGFVKENYTATLALNVVFFVLFFALDFVQGVWGEILLFGLVVPYFVAVLVECAEGK